MMSSPPTRSLPCAHRRAGQPRALRGEELGTGGGAGTLSVLTLSRGWLQNLVLIGERGRRGGLLPCCGLRSRRACLCCAAVVLCARLAIFCLPLLEPHVFLLCLLRDRRCSWCSMQAAPEFCYAAPRTPSTPKTVHFRWWRRSEGRVSISLRGAVACFAGCVRAPQLLMACSSGATLQHRPHFRSTQRAVKPRRLPTLRLPRAGTLQNCRANKRPTYQSPYQPCW